MASVGRSDDPHLANTRAASTWGIDFRSLPSHPASTPQGGDSRRTWPAGLHQSRPRGRRARRPTPSPQDPVRRSSSRSVPEDLADRCRSGRFPVPVPTALACDLPFVFLFRSHHRPDDLGELERRRAPPPRPPGLQATASGVVGITGTWRARRRTPGRLLARNIRRVVPESPAPATGARAVYPASERQADAVAFLVERHVVHEVTNDEQPRPYSRSRLSGCVGSGRGWNQSRGRRRSRGAHEVATQLHVDPHHTIGIFAVAIANRVRGLRPGRCGDEADRRADSVPGGKCVADNSTASPTIPRLLGTSTSSSPGSHRGRRFKNAGALSASE